MSTTNLMQRRQQRKKAFADATAGVIGSLAAMLAFYPVDVWKTSLQANSTANTNGGKDNDGDAATATNTDGLLKAPSSKSNEKIGNTTILSAVSTATITATLTRLFRGLPYKIAHTIASSFTYWYVYSIFQTKYAAYQLNHQSQRSRTTIESSSTSLSPSKNSGNSSVVAKLFLTAIAAMINTGITLPLDTISSRRQVALKLMNDGDGENNNRRRRQHQPQEPNYQNQRQQLQKQLQSILSLWNGLLPALMLCTNPAIQYTLYDAFKAAWLVRRRYRVRSGQLRQNRPPLNPHGNSSGQSSSSTTSSSSNSPKRRQHSLTMSEAFACGMISKFIATMITYPLIRCKVMLMVSVAPNITTTASTTSCTSRTLTLFKGGKEECIHPTENGLRVVDEYNNSRICNGNKTLSEDEVQRKHSQAAPMGTKHAISNNANSSSPSLSSSSKGIHKYPYPHSLPLLLLHIYKHDGGIRGWYRGCSLQLLHTVLKSALLMMVRERIAYATHRFFRIEE
ncbi:hypothetical protein ACHAWU_005280 [Discostella pseudostelligera]|uniref:Uncharacterized protein n=1 Tax=Discostella pseudostelligera TaxID=259834 RepID=A0ABD3M3S8_9STRA